MTASSDTLKSFLLFQTRNKGPTGPQSLAGAIHCTKMAGVATAEETSAVWEQMIASGEIVYLKTTGGGVDVYCVASDYPELEAGLARRYAHNALVEEWLNSLRSP